MIKFDMVDHIPLGALLVATTADVALLVLPPLAARTPGGGLCLKAVVDAADGGPVQTALVEGLGDTMFAGLLGQEEQ